MIHGEASRRRSAVSAFGRARVACLAMASIFCAAGCGTTRWSDTPRTATEQMLLSDAIDRSVSQLDLRVLAGKEVFFDDQYLRGMVDENYIISTLRQHILANGAILKEKREEANYVVEARAGAVGTDRHDLLFGVPAVTVPSFVAIPGAPSSIPEVPLVKQTEQRAIAKMVVFAYNRTTGRPVWQSGIKPIRSTAEDTWVFGAGPFQRGTIHDGTQFAGGEIDLPLLGENRPDELGKTSISVTSEVVFPEAMPSRRTEAVANIPGEARHVSAEEADHPRKLSGASPGSAAGEKPPRPSAALHEPNLFIPSPAQGAQGSAVKPIKPKKKGRGKSGGFFDFMKPLFGRK